MNSSRNVRFLLIAYALLAVIASGCTIRIQPSNAGFDKVAGKGPLVLVSTDETQPSQQFLREHVGESEALRHLIRERGTPEALSGEREFLQPTRLKLFYPAKGQVYVCERYDGEWFVVGAEAISMGDQESLTRQRAVFVAASEKPKSATPAITERPSENMTVAPVVYRGELRGQLKPPGAAQVAKLSRHGETYHHEVTFSGETIALISDWYTESPTNARAIANYNRLSLSEAPRMGSTIAIPQRLMRNPQPLPEAIVP
jgi:hypothetical protein